MVSAIKLSMWIIAAIILWPVTIPVIVALCVCVVMLIVCCIVGALVLCFGIQFNISMIIGAIMSGVAKKDSCNLAIITHNLCIADQKNDFIILTFETFIWLHIVLLFLFICCVIIAIVLGGTGYLTKKLEKCSEKRKLSMSTIYGTVLFYVQKNMFACKKCCVSKKVNTLNSLSVELEIVQETKPQIIIPRLALTNVNDVFIQQNTNQFETVQSVMDTVHEVQANVMAVVDY